MTGLVAAQTALRRAGHPVWHLVAVAAASVAVFGGIKAWEWWGSKDHRASSDINRPRPWARPINPLGVGVALASLGCSVTHAAVGPEHFREAAAFGVFFLIASALQAAWALLVIRRPDPLLLLIGVAGNAGVLILWAITRTVGLPIGPETWRPEAVSAPDLLASILEVTVVAGASWLLLHGTPGTPVSREKRAPRLDRRRPACAPLDPVGR